MKFFIIVAMHSELYCIRHSYCILVSMIYASISDKCLVLAPDENRTVGALPLFFHNPRSIEPCTGFLMNKRSAILSRLD